MTPTGTLYRIQCNNCGKTGENVACHAQVIAEKADELNARCTTGNEQ